VRTTPSALKVVEEPGKKSSYWRVNFCAT